MSETPGNARDNNSLGDFEDDLPTYRAPKKPADNAQKADPVESAVSAESKSAAQVGASSVRISREDRQDSAAQNKADNDADKSADKGTGKSTGKDEKAVPAAAATSERKDPTTALYERTGRAAPQVVPGRRVTEAPGTAGTDSADPTKPTGVSGVAEPTRAFGAEHAEDDVTVAAPTSGTRRRPRTRPAEEADPATGLLAASTGAATAGAGDTAVATQGPTADEDAAPVSLISDDDARRGTIDFGLLVLRAGVGIAFIIHALTTFFQLGGSPGLTGLESEFSAYPASGILAILVPTLELAAGVFLVLGLITPLFAALASIATGFVLLHRINGEEVFYNLPAWDDGTRLALVMLIATIALQFTGPGLYALDYPRGWARRPVASSWIFFVISIVALGAIWWFGTATNPFA